MTTMSLQIASVLTLALVTLAFADHDPVNKCKNFNGNSDCPSYTVISRHDDYDVREYSASTWVTTEMTDSRSTFWRLFNYIRGSNSESQSIPMTAPVIMPYDFANGSVTDGPLAMSFFLNLDENTNAPEPTEEGVDVDELPSFRVYVRSYGGFSSPSRVRQEAKRVFDALTPAEQEKITDVYFAGYDAPFRFFRRHNEVMLVQGHF